jgi:ABC-type phosphate transport system ATPase subunit
MENVLEAKNVNVFYGDFQALKNINMKFKKML